MFTRFASLLVAFVFASQVIGATIDRREAVNPVDACNGSNNYGVGHSCSWNSGSGVNEGTCQDDSDGVLTCVANTLSRREAVNPVDACNGSNNYDAGHSCSWNSVLPTASLVVKPSIRLMLAMGPTTTVSATVAPGTLVSQLFQLANLIATATLFALIKQTSTSSDNCYLSQ